MQIEETDYEYETNPNKGCFSWLCCCRQKAVTENPDLKIEKKQTKGPFFVKYANMETGYLIHPRDRKGTGKTMAMLRRENASTRQLPTPEESIKKSNGRKYEMMSFQPKSEMNVSDLNNLIRRRLSFSVTVNDSNESGEIGEALFPQRSNQEAAPLLMSQLATDSQKTGRHSLMVNGASSGARRRSSFKADIEKFRTSLQLSKALDLKTIQRKSLENKTDKEFLDGLLQTSHFMKEVLEKDWDKTKNYVKWIESQLKNSIQSENVGKSSEKWMVILYTSSDTAADQLMTFRCMLVRLLLQHHCVAYEERDVSLPQFQSEYKERLKGNRSNVPQVFMHGLCIGGYRVIYAIHKMGLAKTIFKKVTIPAEKYSDWMFKKESKKCQLTLDVNLKAFPTLQALASSLTNDKLSPQDLEHVTTGKLVVKHAREEWYRHSTQMYVEPDLRRYALYRLTILHALISMNKIYKRYANHIDSAADVTAKAHRRLSWLPRLSKSPSKG